MNAYFFNVLTAFFLISNLLLAQNSNKRFRDGGVVTLEDSLISYNQSDIFTFPNINKVSYFNDAARLRKINQENDSQKKYLALRDYVKNFGIENFYRNTTLLWELAKLSGKHGPPGEAVLLYKIVLKHHRQDINPEQVRREYDTLTRNERDYYVPLEYYYQLVAYRKEIDTLQPPHGVLLNMGPFINSEHPDYGPTIGNMDDLLLFTSKRNRRVVNFEQTYDEDLFLGIRTDGGWYDVKEFSTINTSYNEGSACLSLDGKFLYFSRCNSPDSYGNCDLYVAEFRSDSTWGNVRNLGAQINSSAWDSHPSLSHSGDTLFFASNRLNGFGLSDIYYAVKDKDGNWSKAMNIGPVINTRGNELGPFLHHKFNVLYFSSDGEPLNFGKRDIYKSYKEGNVWGEPKNIGPLVNGPGDEYYFTIDSRSKELFYARSEESDPDNLDLYSFPVPMEAQPEAVATLHGSLKDRDTGKPLQGIVSIIDLDEGVEVAPKYLRPDGTFDFKLINKRNYLIIIQGDDFFRIEELFFMDGDMEFHKDGEPVTTRIEFQSVEFAPNKADILPEMTTDLKKVADFLIDHPSFTLRIAGHTDSQGREDANLKLSQERADAIRTYLITEQHIAPERITAIGYGSSRPIVTEITEEDRKLNRRVEFELREEGK